MAEPFSVERRKLMRFLGAKVVHHPAAERAVAWSRRGGARGKHGWFMTRQFENEANPDIPLAHHRARDPRRLRGERSITGSPVTAPAAR
jgi:cysteine synthase